MSDPIVDILRSKLLFSEMLYAEEIAKQIRQQIGRELLELFMERAMWGNRGIEIIINEICQMEES